MDRVVRDDPGGGSGGMNNDGTVVFGSFLVVGKD
jgi:hypothetical protein